MRKMGLAEGLAYTFIITTVIQYCINWAAYWEKKFTFKEHVSAQVRILVLSSLSASVLMYRILPHTTHPEKLAVDHKKILIDGDLDFLKEAPFWNQEMKKIKFPMDVQKSYELSKLIP